MGLKAHPTTLVYYLNSLPRAIPSMDATTCSGLAVCWPLYSRPMLTPSRPLTRSSNCDLSEELNILGFFFPDKNWILKMKMNQYHYFAFARLSKTKKI